MRTVIRDGIDKEWSVITLGCWELAPSAGWGDVCPEKDAERVVKEALDAGITAFDTAEGYGDGESERRLGKALGDKKDDVIVISKVWPDAELSVEGYEERIDGTLKALGRDYVDVYLVHWPGDNFNTPERSMKLVDCMRNIKAKEKAKLVGLSNFHAVDLELLGDGVDLFSINQVPYNLLDRRYEGQTLNTCQAHGLAYMAYSPIAKGLLARRMNPEDLKYNARKHDEYFHPDLMPSAVKVFDVVEHIAKEIGCLPLEVALAWVLAQRNILTAIVGTKNPSHVPELALGGDLILNDHHMDMLRSASEVFASNQSDYLKNEKI